MHARYPSSHAAAPHAPIARCVAESNDLRDEVGGPKVCLDNAKTKRATAGQGHLKGESKEAGVQYPLAKTIKCLSPSRGAREHSPRGFQAGAGGNLLGLCFLARELAQTRLPKSTAIAGDMGAESGAAWAAGSSSRRLLLLAYARLTRAPGQPGFVDVLPPNGVDLSCPAA